MMSTELTVPMILAFLHVFQPNVAPAELDTVPAEPVVVESGEVEAAKGVLTDPLPQSDEAKPAPLLSCDLNVVRTGEHRDVRVILNSGEEPVGGDLFIEVHASGANEQVMRRGVSAHIDSGQSEEVFGASMTLSGEAEFTAAVTLESTILPCTLK